MTKINVEDEGAGKENHGNRYNRYPVEIVINQFERSKSVSAAARSFKAKRGYDKMYVTCFFSSILSATFFLPLVQLIVILQEWSVFCHRIIFFHPSFHTNRESFHANF